GPCSGTKIIPYVKVADGGWQESTNLTVEPGASVLFGPHPWDGKIWSWTGPADFSSTTRENTLTNLQWQNSGIYTIEYTNETGCKSYEKIKLVVNDPEHPYVEPDTSVKDSLPEGIINAGQARMEKEIYANPVQVQYFDMKGALLQGRPANPGVYFRRESFGNGKSKIVKIRF
ncbi:MAG: hypothetical protein HUK20_10200, partial [Fibrobacter sp.]|nr:hypothetical protein [Fibrobacter sp.]